MNWVQMVAVFVAVVGLFSSSWAQGLDDVFNRIATLVLSTTSKGTGQGTAFFYQQLEPPKLRTQQPQWRGIEKVWLVTNRHVLVPKFDGQELFPSSITFYLRRIKDDQIQWDPVTLSNEEVRKRARFHEDHDVDVCLLDISDILIEKGKAGNLVPWYGLSSENFVGNNKISVEAGDDILVIGFPRGFYDDLHLFPIIKAGIIASRWGVPFRGKPFFLIDAKLFPGSSGSLVISKPREFVIEKNQIFTGCCPNGAWNHGNRSI